MPTLFTKMDRYVLRQLSIALSVISVSLIFVIWLSRSLRFVDYIVNRGVSLSSFGYLTALLLPSLLNFILPLTVFICIIFTYHRLSQDSEIVVSYASGLSPRMMARPALYLCLFVTLFGYLQTSYLIPASYRGFKDLQYEIRHAFSVTLLEEGVFSEINDQVTVYVRERKDTGELSGILVHDMTNALKPVTIIAEKGAIIETPDGPRVFITNGQRQEYDKNKGRTSLLYFEEYALDLSQDNKIIETRWREPRERFIPDLLFPQDNSRNRKYWDKLLTEGHYRLIHPLYSLAFGLVGVYLTLMSRFSRRGDRGYKIFISVACVVLWQAAALGAQNLSNKDASYAPLMYVVLIVPLSILTFLLLRNIAPSTFAGWIVNTLFKREKQEGR